MDQLLKELQTYLDVEMPAFRKKWAEDFDSWEARLDWQRTLDKERWAAPAWAVENGGRGLGIAELLAVEAVLYENGSPQLPGTLGLKNVGPTLARWGTEDQKKHLPRILSTDEIWCQGFSEPGAGSDLAGLRTRAVRDGDEFVVNGQKIWTSNGTRATNMELLVRTDPDAPKHKGISVLLVDLKTPGVEVRAIRQISGGAEFAEVFFTDVRVPAQNLLGPLNDGWTVTRTTLGHERSGVAVFAARFEKSVRQLIDENAAAKRSKPLTPDQVDKLVRHYVESRVVGMLSQEMLARLVAGEQPGAEQSVIKLAWSEAAQRLSSTVLDLDGIDGVSNSSEAAVAYLGARAQTIAAGTSQIVRNILAERVLGLPRD
ncbi:acyl-CoA dehydrogenase family protein [Jatrophihabitans sp. DSM 45814]